MLLHDDGDYDDNVVAGADDDDEDDDEEEEEEEDQTCVRNSCLLSTSSRKGFRKVSGNLK